MFIDLATNTINEFVIENYCLMGGVDRPNQLLFFFTNFTFIFKVACELNNKGL